MKEKRIIFMGTPDFAVPCFEALVRDGYCVTGVFTQSDKPKGRGYKLTPPPVKVAATAHNIAVFQPEKLDENAVSIIKEQNPDIIIVVAYGKILPSSILDIPKLGCINIHGSLLPKYRGAAPIQWSVINGDFITGVTSMYMDRGLDTGDMILKSETEILPNETAGELYNRLSAIGAQLLIKTVDQICLNQAPREKQNEKMSSYAPMLHKDMARIDWAKTNTEIDNLVRGTNPWPIAWTTLKNETVKIFAVKKIDQKYDGAVGTITEISKEDGIVVSCGDGAIGVLQLQFPGNKRMNTQDYLRGHKLDLDSRFL